MRSEVIAGFSYTAKPVSVPARTDAVRAPNNHGDPLDPDVVVMDPLVVRADRGLSPRQFRALDASVQEQDQRPSASRFSIVKVHDVKLSRKVHFGYVTLFGVPVVAGFSW